MRKLIILCISIAVVATLSSSLVMADEKASTIELPAALQAIGVDQSKILSQDEAQQVRGEAFIAFFRIDFVNANFATRVEFAGVFNAVIIFIDPMTLSLAIL